MAGDLVTLLHWSWRVTVYYGKHLWTPSGTIDPCYKVHEVDVPTFLGSFEVGNGMVSRVVLASPRVSRKFIGYFVGSHRPTHTKVAYILRA